MFDEIYNSALHATEDELRTLIAEQFFNVDVFENTPPFHTPAGKLAANNHVDAAEKLRSLGANANAIAQGYAMARNYDQVKNYRVYLNADIAGLVRAYAFAGNDAQVDFYLTEYSLNEYQYTANVNAAALGYALANNSPKAEGFRLNDFANTTTIAEGFLFAGNDEQVDEYCLLYKADVNIVAQSYATIGRFDKVEEFRVKHGADVRIIAKAPITPETPLFYRALHLLTLQGDMGDKIISTILRLKKGDENRWNPYWMNSGEKLKRILIAIEGLQGTATTLPDALNDKTSELYKAINMARITPLTLFNKQSVIINQTRSLTTVLEAVSNAL